RDSIPYPLNFSTIALLVGLLYNDKNLNELCEYIKDITIKDINKIKVEMRETGLEAKLKGESLLNIGKYLLKLAERGLEDKDKHYLNPLKEMLDKGMNPYMVTKSKAKDGKKETLDWCILKNIVKDKRYGSQKYP